VGIRAFGTQLLCEQVIGRSLRRQFKDDSILVLAPDLVGSSIARNSGIKAVMTSLLCVPPTS
jgi:hypothetical protein